jgi:hypothetical protein
LTSYDWLLARRSFSLGLVLAILIFLVMLATDDAASTLPGRLGRFAGLASLAGALGTFIAASQARWRGEMRALEAAGLTPMEAGRGAVLGGTVVGVLGSTLASLPSVDLSPLFPRVMPLAAWIWQGDSWLDASLGVVVRASGDLSRVGPLVVNELGGPPIPRAATVLVLGLSALVFPFWAIAPAAPSRRWGVGLLVAATSVAAFHMVAAGRLAPLALAVPVALPLADAVLLRRRAPWR